MFIIAHRNSPFYTSLGLTVDLQHLSDKYFGLKFILKVQFYLSYNILYEHFNLFLV